MRLIRVLIGILVLLLIAGGVGAGVWVLYEHGGGGLTIEVTFADSGAIAPRDSVVYGDTIIGRVDSVESTPDGRLVRARIAAENASLVREGSRFWIDDRVGSAILMFDRTSAAGAPVGQRHRFRGLSARPEPDPELKPPQIPRPLSVRPVWLCEVRATITTRHGEQAQSRERKGAAAIVHVTPAGDVLVLCANWLVEPAGEVIESSLRVEIIGEGTRVARVLHRTERHAVLFVPETAYKEMPAKLWPNELAEGQPVVLSDYDGTSYTAQIRSGGLDLKGVLPQGHVALVEGVQLAGFALPNVGKLSGARWISLHGAGDAIEGALSALR